MPENSQEISPDLRLEHITNINAAPSAKELLEIWKTCFHNFGFDHLTYSVFSGFSGHEMAPPTYVSKIPEKIQKEYSNQLAKPYDPVLKYTFSTMESLWLSDAAALPYFQDNHPQTFIKNTLDIYQDALCIPIIGPNFLKGYICAAYNLKSGPSQKRFNKGDFINWYILGLSHLIHTRYSQLLMSTQMKVDLTKREIDVLQLVASGKTNREIGKILGISINTVNTYLKNIFLKMNTTDRVTTAIKAYSLNLITTPQQIPRSQYLEADFHPHEDKPLYQRRSTLKTSLTQR